MDDARKSGVCSRRGYVKLKGARFVDCSGIHRISRFLFHRHALAGDGSLVDHRTAGNHKAVKGDFLAGFHTHTTADRHFADIHFAPASILPQHRGGIRRKGKKVLDGVARPVQGLCFNGFRHIEQHHDHCRFRELPDENGSRDSDGHKRIDVQIEVGDGQPAFSVGCQSAQRNGDDGKEQGQIFQYRVAPRRPR